MIRKHLLYNWL